MKFRVYNNTLDPNIWNDDKTIKPEIRESLLKIAEDFYNSTELNGEIVNILFIGSSANYNWSPTSDMDLHIVIDISEEKIHDEYARKFMDALGFKWNTEHDIEIKGHPVEVYLQDVREPNSSVELSREGAAIYSLFDGKWIQEPSHEKIDLDAEKIKKKFQLIKAKAKNLIETEDIDKLKELMKSIRNYRNTGLAKGGEFCTENLVFKALRKSEVLKQIKDTINTVYDKKVSIPEHGNTPPTKKTDQLNEDNTQPNRKQLRNLMQGPKMPIPPEKRYSHVKLTYPKFGSFDIKKNIIVGWTDKDSLESFSNKDWLYHPTLFSRMTAERWRYKGADNTLYFTELIDEKVKDATLIHLEDKYGVKNVNVKIGTDAYFGNAHPKNESVNEGVEPYTLVGSINRDYDVYSIIDYRNTAGHSELPQYRHGDKRWRYNSKRNTVYWDTWGEKCGSEMDRDVVNVHLDKKYGIVNPTHKLSSEYYSHGHNINEETQNYLVVGWINKDLEIIAEKDLIGGNNVTHEDLMLKNPMFDDNQNWADLKQWRYKSKTNTLYWYEDADGNQRTAVIGYLKAKYGVVNPRESRTTDLSGHRIDENLVDRKAELYLGFVNKENFKTIGIDVHDDSITHAQWQRTLSKEYQWYYGTEALLWRYKRNTNTVYWWSMYSSPNDEERQSVEDWLFKNANIKYPKHQMISWDRDAKSINRRLASHTIGSDYDKDDDFIDESVESVMANLESKGSGLFFKQKA